VKDGSQLSNIERQKRVTRKPLKNLDSFKAAFIMPSRPLGQRRRHLWLCWLMLGLYGVLAVELRRVFIGFAV
jgi:hypothetical protein